jgi:hypothetical protein
MRKRRNGWLGTFVVTALLAACGGSNNPPLEPDQAIQPFVGTWDAEVFTVTSDADPTVVADLMENGSFFLNIQPSGFYTATLVFGGIPLVETGQMSVAGGFVTLRPNAPDSRPATSAFTFLQSDYLRLAGPTDFDFNLDGELDPAQALIELRRR